jgi:FkbM family methyltransferase
MNPAEQVAALQADELRMFESLTDGIATRSMIDVGAHHGATLVPFLNAGWRVWAFEPIEANRAVLTRRFGDCDRLEVRPEAVSDRTGTAAMHLALNLDGSEHDYYHSLERTRADRYHRKGRVVEAPVVRLDDLVGRGEIPERVGFLKVDTEGHDLAVLRGAGRLMCDVVGVEFWGDRHPLGRSPSPAADMIRLMADRGYDAYLALCHEGRTTRVLGCSLEGVRPDAWGNLLFFHGSGRGLYGRLHERFGRSAETGPAPDHPETRLARLLTLAFPGRDGLTVVQPEGEPADGAAELRGALPGTRGVRFRPAAGETVDGVRREAGRVDLIRLAAPADAARLLAGARAVLAEDQPAVLASAALAPPAGDQSAFHETLRILDAAGYRLAALVAPTVSEEGLLASADFLFLPPCLHARCCAAAGPFGHEDAAALAEQARQLQRDCDARLHVIDQLRDAVDREHAAAEERLADAEERLTVIRCLDQERERLAAAAQERLTLIGELHAEMGRLAEERMAVIRGLEERLSRTLDVRVRSWLRRILRHVRPGRDGRRAAS